MARTVDELSEKPLPHVVVIGGGFGGLWAARGLARAPVRVTLVDRQNYHLFQPLLYQVATAGLSAPDIASPIRSIVRDQPNTTVLLAEASAVDLERRRVILDDAELAYDFLVLAPGSGTNYFGHPEWEAVAPGLKSVDDALAVRRRVLLAFEAAERERDPRRRSSRLTFAVIGGGPTGVELVGAIAELARRALRRDFRIADPSSAKIYLLEGGPRILPMFEEDLADHAREELGQLGVGVVTGARVVGVDRWGVDLAGGGRIDAGTTIWAAGVRPSALAESLGVSLVDGRIPVSADLSLPGHAEVFVVGDLADVRQGGGVLPGLAAVAVQEGSAAADAIDRTVTGRQRRPFHYRDKGMMATVGRSRAVARFGRVHLSGPIAWLTWLVVHIFLLMGFRNRAVVMLTWIWSYVTFKRGARVITGLEHPAVELAC